jgi:sugar O-acyltransferase (sialic acid O-acetyltransferase NeuD family)
MQLVIGTGGLSKQSLSSLKLSNESTESELVFFENVDGIDEFFGYRVIHDYSEISKPFGFVICLGNPIHRKKFYDDLIELGGYPLNVFSEYSLLFDCELGVGNLILPYSLLEPSSKIGNNNLINCYVGIFHDVVIGDHNEIMPGAKLLGCSSIGSNCRIGSNATILPNVSICDNVNIGAGTVVINDITESGTYVGVPARKVR